ncbi:MAG: ATP-binding protein [Eubacterium sp.]|nr:ATP-binding protein [Eubacterium sp.]
MKELALHILDITQNSVRAGARVIRLTIDEAVLENRLTITVEDDGSGIPPEILPEITNPFVTSRTTRRVGLGLPLFKSAAEGCGGSFDIQSEVGVGTRVSASFEYDNIDRMPLGNMPDTVITMLMSFGEAELVYLHRYNQKTFAFDSREIKEILQEDSLLGDPDILNWIRGYVEEGLGEIMEE